MYLHSLNIAHFVALLFNKKEKLFFVTTALHSSMNGHLLQYRLHNF